MIRPARKEEFEVLTRISFLSKRFWNYPDEYFSIWQRELTITADYITTNEVWVYEKKGEVVGYYSLVNLTSDMEIEFVTLKKGLWLDHMFLLPAFIGTGIGRKMIDHLKGCCSKRNVSRVDILVDPYARGFYEKIGCRYVGEVASTIAGRTTPHLVLAIR